MNYHIPICNDNYVLYDIFHNDNNELIIIIPYIPTPYTIKYVSYDNTIIPFALCKCPHKHTIIYKIKADYRKKIKLVINGCFIETLVNKYPSFKDEIIFSTIVKDEDDFIVPWINYHLKLGVTRFIIYDNSTKHTLSSVLDEYIKNNIVLLIKWKYPYIIEISGISGQTTQQNHSIYAFRECKYIGLFDIDEYVNLQGISNLPLFFKILIIKENIKVGEISSFQLLNKFFYNPNNLPVNDSKYFHIFTCDAITKSGHEKNFVIPKNINTFSVHMVTSGKPMYTINYRYAYFNHYCYLNKSGRGRNVTNYIDDTILQHL